MQRRSFLVGAAGALAAPHIARAQASRVLKFVPDADLASLDPVWTTSYQTRDHGYMVFDTLYGQDSKFRPSPQMLEGALVDNDGKLWKLALRNGLKFHDGERVLAADCIASIKRWGARDSFGQALMAAIDEMAVVDDRTFTIRLKYAFPLLPEALSKTAPSMCPIMPARLAETDPFKQVTEMVGSGPFRFKADERIPGARVVWERNADYVPRPNGTPDRTSGPKIVNFDRVEWQIMPDSSTVASALQRGEIDWWYTPPTDLQPLLAGSRGVKTEVIVPTGTIATMRFNHLQKPFDNPAIRRAMFGAIIQSDYMTAVAGEDRSRWRDGVGYFCPGTPMASDAGMERLTGKHDLDQAKRDLAAAGYKGERVVLLGPMDIPSTKAMAEVTADVLKKLGVNLDFQAMDWATLVQRRIKTEPVEQGGWSIFQTSWSGLDQFNPAGHVFLRANGRNAAPGWPTSEKLESLRDDWLKAPDLAAQKKLAEQMQLQAFEDVPYIPLGQTITPTAFRSDLTGMLDGLPLFWNIKRG
jgi:peptide/nickel transport system substrate-binding protein